MSVSEKSIAIPRVSRPGFPVLAKHCHVKVSRFSGFGENSKSNPFQGFSGFSCLWSEKEQRNFQLFDVFKSSRSMKTTISKGSRSFGSEVRTFPVLGSEITLLFF